MKQEIQIIKVYPFLKPYKRQKDGLQQVMVRVKLGSKNKGKTSILKTIDIPLLSENEEIIRLTKQQFDNRKNENGVMLRYYEVIGLLNKGIYILSKEGFESNTKLLFKLVYSKTNKENDEDEKLIENEDVERFFGHPVPEKVWESFISQTYTDELTGEPVLFEEL